MISRRCIRGDKGSRGDVPKFLKQSRPSSSWGSLSPIRSRRWCSCRNRIFDSRSCRWCSCRNSFSDPLQTHRGAKT
ncbi:hypothetical protein HA466_0237580 [Hirschfeldia incana]|nr:hypothetical protein HA466_0237580 [Hirschfeldia incana]KAJ0238577.1 hypothetical protein HA466_0237580 [Hirschfeldia incana]